VREDALGLFGFSTPDELTFFKLLLSVKGIGPKAGLGILSRAEIGTLKRAILKEDAALLATVPGIGPKTAARVVLELKGKLKEEMFGEEARVPAGVAGDAMAQALQVLTGLGYSPAEAKEAVRKATAGNGGSHTLEQLVTVALKGLDRG
jgi:Holliday junction DNA helicase RuvA